MIAQVAATTRLGALDLDIALHVEAGRSLAPAECRAYAARPYRALAASEVGHWRACQSCSSLPKSTS